MPDFTPGNSNEDFVELVFPDAGVRCSQFVEYQFNSHFLRPTDGFNFVLDSRAGSTKMTTTAAPLSDDPDVWNFFAKDVMKPGARVELHLNSSVQATGFIDSVDISASPSGGHIYQVQGRDAMAQAVDACADPTQEFKDGETLDEALVELFAPFNFTEFLISNAENRDLRTNAFRSKSQRSDGRGFGKRALKEYKIHQTRPYPKESVFQFASRLANRQGLHIWPSADGERLIVDVPDFNQEPTFELRRYFLGSDQGLTNVLSGSVRYDISQQPTAIVCDTYSANGEFGPGAQKIVLINDWVLVVSKEPPPYEKYLKAGAELLHWPERGVNPDVKMESPRHRVLYLHDDESANGDQLKAFAQREMALLQQGSLTAHFTVEGHGQKTPAGYRTWAVDTTVRVLDEASGLAENLYVLSRTFHKSRESGTFTELELIRLDTLTFSDTGK